MPKPQCLALIICDLIIEDQRSGNKSLIGLFNTIAAQALPVNKHMFVFLSVGGMEVLQSFTLKLMGPPGLMAEMNINPEADQPTEPGIAHDFVFDIPGLPLPQEGLYFFELWHRDTLLGRRGFEVMLHQPAPAKPLARG